MSLESKTRQIINNFEKTSSQEILDLLQEIQNYFKNQDTKNYLNGKMNAISKISNENEKKTMCKKLLPYLDWYLQGQ